jgi:branched-chain amino acid transport system substrate-binding protein
MRENVVLAVIIGCCLAGSACAPEPVVGVLIPESGHAEAYGHAVNNGIHLALNEARASNTLPEGFRLIEADTGSRPDHAANELRRIASTLDVELVVGGVTTDEALALLPVVEDEKVVCLSPSASASSLTGKSPYFFRLFATDEVEGSTAARYLHETRSARSVLVITDDSTFSRGLEAEFRQHYQLRLGGEIVATVHDELEWWKRKATDMVNALEPDAVYIVGHAEHILTSLELLQKIGYEGVKCTTSAVYLAELLEQGNPALEGVVFPLTALRTCEQENDNARECPFVDRYQDEYGGQPDFYAAHGYDAMRVALRALVNARSVDVSELRRYMRIGLQEFDGVTGTIAFDERGDVRRYPTMHTIWNSRVVKCRWLYDMKKRQLKQIIEGITPTRAQPPTPALRLEV